MCGNYPGGKVQFPLSRRLLIPPPRNGGNDPEFTYTFALYPFETGSIRIIYPVTPQNSPAYAVTPPEKSQSACHTYAAGIVSTTPRQVTPFLRC